MKKIYIPLLFAALLLSSCDKVKSIKDRIFGTETVEEVVEEPEDSVVAVETTTEYTPDYDEVFSETTEEAAPKAAEEQPNATAQEVTAARSETPDYNKESSAAKQQPAVVEEPQERSYSGQIYTAVEQPAEFPGGQSALMTFLSNNIRYPEAAQQNGISGRVIVKFVVEKDGSISSASVVKGVDRDLDAEALRVVRRMPKWKPGKNSGQPVRSYFTLPVTFKLSN